MPKLKSDKKLSAAAKKEWARFMMELKAHENEHVADFVKTATQIGKDIDKLTAKGQGADKKASDKAAMAEYTTAFDQKFSDTENSKRLNAGADALDTGGHGPTLNTSIP